MIIKYLFISYKRNLVWLRWPLGMLSIQVLQYLKISSWVPSPPCTGPVQKPDSALHIEESPPIDSKWWLISPIRVCSFLRDLGKEMRKQKQAEDLSLPTPTPVSPLVLKISSSLCRPPERGPDLHFSLKEGKGEPWHKTIHHLELVLQMLLYSTIENMLCDTGQPSHFTLTYLSFTFSFPPTPNRLGEINIQRGLTQYLMLSRH